MPEPRVVILGGGPAGVGAAYQLRRQKKAEVVLIERGQGFGGNAGSFEHGGQRLDYGSHRLHPASDPDILEDVGRLLGDDLLDRPRHGRIRLLGKWIHFPLKPVDLLLRLDKSFAAGSLRDMVKKTVAKPDEGETFESVLQANLGRTICDHFYFPYAVKLWGHEPAKLSGIQARKRVSAGNFLKLIKKVMGQVPGLKKPGAGRFFYPRRGFGQISEAYAEAARAAGADLRTGCTMTGLEIGNGVPWRVTVESDGRSETLDADYVWSTIPVTVLARSMNPAPPPEVLEAAGRIGYRSMILIYARLAADRFTEFDAHYFPGADTRITRMSEPKNYAALTEPKGSTVLCAELPCQVGDDVWSMSDGELGELFARDVANAGIPFPSAPVEVWTRRLPQAYPVYLNGYEEPFGLLDRWVEEQPRVLSYGRQGLFAHDNTHHALAMAYRAVECLNGGEFDREAWARHREAFAKHVVED